jgi:tetratricopeptide (TPR) repeat protein
LLIAGAFAIFINKTILEKIDKKKEIGMKQNFILAAICTCLTAIVLTGFECSAGDYSLAKEYVNKKENDKALPLLEKETKINPTNAEAWYLLGRIRGDKGDYAGMNTAFDSTLKYSKEKAGDIAIVRYAFWGIHLNAGVSYLRRASSDSTQYYRRALDEFFLALAAKPDTVFTYEFLSSAYYGKGDIDSALIMFTIPWTKFQDADLYKQAGKIYLQRGVEKKNKFETDNAELLKIQKILGKAKKGISKDDIVQALGLADATKKDKKTKKEEWTYSKYGLTVNIDKDNALVTKPYHLPIDSTVYREAAVYFNKAVQVFEEVKAKNPKDNENLNLLLQSYVYADQIAEAAKAFKLSVENDPGNKTNHYILGILYKTINDFVSAVAEFEAALRIDPAYGDAIYELGATYYNWGVDIHRQSQDAKEGETIDYKSKFKSALPYIEKMTELKPKNAAIWQTLGTIYLQLGEADKAKKALDEVDKIQNGK